MNSIHFALVLCLTFPPLAFAQNKSPSDEQQRNEAPYPALLTKDKSFGKAAEALLPIQVSHDYKHDKDKGQVPLSDYINGGHYSN